MITKYELPEEADFNLLSNFGEEVEMKTFKTNVPPTLECDKDQVLKIKILCLGDYTGGVGRKGVFINDYLQVTPPVPNNQYPVLGCDFYLKTTKWKKGEDHDPVTITIQFWEIGEQERYCTRMTNVYYRDSHGTLVFWGPGNSSSLDGAPKWLKDVNRACLSIPCVLVTDNTSNKPLYGPGEKFESEMAFDQFWKNHGFVGHFEIKSRDWESGENSVFGQAVNCLIEKILTERT
ncbi:ras-related protein Rab-38-like [Porites lutea]|uniref:ras-related protein Rab-38-like n=1 Tax=Porites lutea TaxID=51062 RepID=UPI003CC5B633